MVLVLKQQMNAFLKQGGTLNNPDRLKAEDIYSIKQSCFSSGSTYVLCDEIKSFS